MLKKRPQSEATILISCEAAWCHASALGLPIPPSASPRKALIINLVRSLVLPVVRPSTWDSASPGPGSDENRNVITNKTYVALAPGVTHLNPPRWYCPNLRYGFITSDMVSSRRVKPNLADRQATCGAATTRIAAPGHTATSIENTGCLRLSGTLPAKTTEGLPSGSFRTAASGPATVSERRFTGSGSPQKRTKEEVYLAQLCVVC